MRRRGEGEGRSEGVSSASMSVGSVSGDEGEGSIESQPLELSPTELKGSEAALEGSGMSSTGEGGGACEVEATGMMGSSLTGDKACSSKQEGPTPPERRRCSSSAVALAELMPLSEVRKETRR